jgi:hypothetical protein
MYSEIGGRIRASMEENDDLPVYRDHTLRSLFYHPPFRRTVHSRVIPVIPHDRVDDAQEFP